MKEYKTKVIGVRYINGVKITESVVVYDSKEERNEKFAEIKEGLLEIYRRRQKSKTA